MATKKSLLKNRRQLNHLTLLLAGSTSLATRKEVPQPFSNPLFMGGRTYTHTFYTSILPSPSPHGFAESASKKTRLRPCTHILSSRDVDLPLRPRSHGNFASPLGLAEFAANTQPTPPGGGEVGTVPTARFLSSRRAPRRPPSRSSDRCAGCVGWRLQTPGRRACPGPGCGRSTTPSFPNGCRLAAKAANPFLNTRMCLFGNVVLGCAHLDPTTISKK